MNMTFQNILDDFRNELNCPGILMGVEAEAMTWYGSTGCFLEEDLAKPFYIYSITKSYTAVCILKLAEDGCLSLDDPLVHHITSLAIPEDVTIRRILNHTAGIRDYASLPEYTEGLRDDPLTPLHRDVLIEKTLVMGLTHTPGTKFLYSNTGYILLYRLIEIAADCSYAEAIHRFITEPLDLSMTQVAVDIDKELSLLPGFAAEPPFNGVDIRQRYHPDWVATGLIISTIMEVIRFYEKVFTGALLSRESLNEMTASVKVDNISCPPFISPSYALGLNHDPDYPLGETYGHGGGGPGYGIYAGYMPNVEGAPAVFCAMCNASLHEPPWHLWSRVMERIKNG